MSSIQVLTEFKKNLVAFFDSLIDLFPSEGDFVLGRILIADQVPITEVMNIFIQQILPHKEAIKRRDDKTIMGLQFGPETASKAGHLKKIWMNPELDQENRDVIWDWVNSFVVLVERYQRALLKESGAQ